MVYIFDFCKNMNPRLYILFSVDKSMMQIKNNVLRIIILVNLLNKYYDRFQISL